MHYGTPVAVIGDTPREVRHPKFGYTHCATALREARLMLDRALEQVNDEAGAEAVSFAIAEAMRELAYAAAEAAR